MPASELCIMLDKIEIESLSLYKEYFIYYIKNKQEVESRMQSLDEKSFKTKMLKYDKIFFEEFLEKILTSLELIADIRKNIGEYSLEIWRNRSWDGDWRQEAWDIPFYAIVDAKGVQRFGIEKIDWHHGKIYVHKITKAYDCNNAISMAELIKKNIFNTKNFFAKSTGIIYEDDNEAFLITTGTLLGDNSRFNVSVTIASESEFKINYSYEKRGSYLKINIFYVTLTVETTHWTVKESIETETYSMK